MQNNAAKSALIEAGRWVSQKGWVPATGGNFSIKTETGFVVTASGYDKGHLAPEHFLELNQQGEITSGNGKPSAETALHLKLYQLQPDWSHTRADRRLRRCRQDRSVRPLSNDRRGSPMVPRTVCADQGSTLCDGPLRSAIQCSSARSHRRKTARRD